MFARCLPQLHPTPPSRMSVSYFWHETAWIFVHNTWWRTSNRPYPGPLFTKPLSGKTSYRQISGSLDIMDGCYNDFIALQFNRRLGNAATDVPVKFQSDRKSLNPNLTASSLHILQWDVRPLSE